MELKLKTEEIRELLEIESPEFPKYVTQILNLANQNAQGTRPKVVGQMSELINKFPGKTLEEWEKWYMEKYPDSIDKATEKISEMINNLKKAMEKIDESMVRRWVKDLVIVKTFIGLKFQKAILKKVAETFEASYKLSTPDEEGRGIDGYIGDIPVSLKPITYNIEKNLSENLEGYIIYYEKQKKGLKIIIPDELKERLNNL